MPAFRTALVLSLALAACAPAVPPRAPTAADYATVLADPVRPAADRARDEARKPAELLAFAEIAPGETVGDFVMGGGYFTRVLSAAVGPRGRVEAFQPAEFIAFRASYGEEQRSTVAALPNAVAISGPFAAPAFTRPLDTIVTIQNFHDLYLKPFPATGAKASAALFAALKPGGVLVVVDHSAAAGSGTRDADTLHRIDKAAVIEALTAAGFKLEAEAPLYARPEDPRTANVFDPAIRGKTDQFALRFRKPG